MDTMSPPPNEAEADERPAAPAASERAAEDARHDAAGDGAGVDELVISNDWARRRLDLYGQVERTMREGIGQALQTAAQIRADVERDADAYLRRLAGERAGLEEAIAALERRREAAEAGLERRGREIDAELETRRRDQEEVLEGQLRAAQEEVRSLRQAVEEETRRLRQAAEEDVARLRSATQAEIDQMVREAETRRSQVAAEVRALEEQVAQIQGVIDSFLDSQLQTLRGSLGATRGQPGVSGRRPEPATGAGGAGLLGTDAPGEARGPAGPSRTASEGTEGTPAPEPPAGRSEADHARTSMVISGLPHFSRARALWQAIQEVPGVAEAKAINYQGGVLAIEVQHVPALDLPASVSDLQGLRLRVTEATPGHLSLTADA